MNRLRHWSDKIALMGRGQRTEAMSGARDLLYGRRLSGTGPIDRSKDPSSPLFVPKRLDNLPWNQYVSGVANLAVSLDLAQPATSDQLELISSDNQEESNYAALDITKNEDERIRLVPTISPDGHSLGIYSAKDNPRNTIYLDKGKQTINDSADAEQILRDELIKRGITRIGLALDGRELLARLDSGRQIELTAGEHSLTSLTPRPWADKIQTAQEMVEEAQRTGYITEAEADQWRLLIDGQPSNHDILEPMKNDRIGRSILGCQANVYVIETLTP